MIGRETRVLLRPYLEQGMSKAVIGPVVLEQREDRVEQRELSGTVDAALPMGAVRRERWCCRTAKSRETLERVYAAWSSPVERNTAACGPDECRFG